MSSSRKREILQVSVKEFVRDYIYRIDLDADYQRDKIWVRKNQEDLIDSIYQNIDIPKLYLAAIDDDSADFECIDGKQRMSAMLAFFVPDPDDDAPLTVRVAGDKLTYRELRKAHPTVARQIEDFELTVVVYHNVDDDFVREIFRRLQLGVPLNSGERLKSLSGAMRDFIFRELGKSAPFIGHSKLSEKRSSREFTLAQICINSFSRAASKDFIRARFTDLEDFFLQKASLSSDDPNFSRIRKVLKIMDREFGSRALAISSRAAAVTAYLFVEEMYDDNRITCVAEFAKFYEKLLDAINQELKRLAAYDKPKNRVILDDFQKYISQASVEPYAIKRRHDFLKRAFAYYQKFDGKILPK